MVLESKASSPNPDHHNLNKRIVFQYCSHIQFLRPERAFSSWETQLIEERVKKNGIIKLEKDTDALK